ncbi:type I-G CRISPR-associated helicase/endonuclease Cas3g [Arhodomonas sp. AD133]|uniref:type I-G CRISPR-associated helicase/endonuclease Cas3g n=1 Tax=Arhodomonas sp. AD133 TaxID=3415009 RepID=UPI003EBBB43F
MEFETFFEAIHGHRPFPWQSEAARWLCAGRPPEVVGVPTGCGKTAMIDVALYHAAYGGPRRIFFIIDRRVVVDEAYLRAERLRQALTDTTSGPLAELAQRLGELQVVRLRGGVHTDESWPWYPERVSIVLSTVDQVGSRLLHRGYGVSSRMWPVHAGFVGNDALYLVDEAHLSSPFVATVQAAASQGADLRLIRLSATPGENSGDMLTLSEQDHELPELKRRLNARKHVSLTSAPSGDAQFVPTMVEQAETVAASHGSGAVIGVVVNQVRTARRIFERLHGKRHETVLLTGRVRPNDRQRTLDQLLPRIHAGRDRHREGSPLFVVATQTVEVGADLDFDALVTELAPLSALRQRFGRVDRLGQLGQSNNHIVARDKFLQKKDSAKAPVYGADLRESWLWLEQATQENSGIDFGALAMAHLLEAMPPPKESASHCPRLLPTHLERFAQTGPDAPRMEPAPWLHGPSRPYREVSVLWRADLNTERPEHWPGHVLERPPQLGEALQLPIHLFRELLSGKGRGDASDLEGTEEPGSSFSDHLGKVMRWRGADEAEIVDGADVVPGDTVLLPASLGGCDAFGWAPGHAGPVEDIGEACAVAEDNRERPFVLRLHPTVDHWMPAESRAEIHEAIRTLHAAEHNFDEEDGPDEEHIETARIALRKRLNDLDHPWLRRLGSTFGYRWLPDGWLVLRREGIEESAARGTDNGRKVPLNEHSDGVAAYAANLAANHPERDRIVRAAKNHDEGKRIHGFQILLHGDAVRAAAGPLLAKSGLSSRSAQKAARERSGLPRGFRHELCSLDYLDDDDGLLRHMVATHHGHGRPWFPPLEDEDGPSAERVHLRGRWASAFANLLQRMGPWRLAELELLVRAADIRRSIEEAQA